MSSATLFYCLKPPPKLNVDGNFRAIYWLFRLISLHLTILLLHLCDFEVVFAKREHYLLQEK